MLALSAMIFCTSCTDFLVDQPESALTQVNFFNSDAKVNQGVMGCYAGLANSTKLDWEFSELRSDNTCQNSTSTTNNTLMDQTDVALFRTSPSLTVLQDYWYSIFQNISKINAVLPALADTTIVPDASKRAQYEAELLFIRAYHYYTLVNLFGDMFKVTSVMSAADAKKLKRLPADSISNQVIIPDLIKAANQAPASYSVNDKGRVTKWAAKALLAKTYMMIGGASNLALAKALLLEVLAAPQHKLLTGTGAFASIFSIDNEMNDEIIFAVRYKGGDLGLGSPFWSYFAPASTANTYLRTGTPYGYNVPTSEIMKLFLSDPNDSRTKVSFSKATTKAYIGKFQDPSISQVRQSENDWIVIRYADVVLLYAEVLAQDGNYATAHLQVNLIRNRAGLSTLSAFTSKDKALDAVYKERRLELAFENQRWYDLLRMNKSYGNPNKAMEVMKTHVFVTDFAALYNKYTSMPKPDVRYFVNERLLLPIPQYEIDTNNEMMIHQNADY